MVNLDRHDLYKQGPTQICPNPPFPDNFTSPLITTRPWACHEDFLCHANQLHYHLSSGSSPPFLLLLLIFQLSAQMSLSQARFPWCSRLEQVPSPLAIPSCISLAYLSSSVQVFVQGLFLTRFKVHEDRNLVQVCYTVSQHLIQCPNQHLVSIQQML